MVPLSAPVSPPALAGALPVIIVLPVPPHLSLALRAITPLALLGIVLLALVPGILPCPVKLHESAALRVNMSVTSCICMDCDQDLVSRINKREKREQKSLEKHGRMQRSTHTLPIYSQIHHYNNSSSSSSPSSSSFSSPSLLLLLLLPRYPLLATLHHPRNQPLHSLPVAHRPLCRRGSDRSRSRDGSKLVQRHI